MANILSLSVETCSSCLKSNVIASREMDGKYLMSEIKVAEKGTKNDHRTFIYAIQWLIGVQLSY